MRDAQDLIDRADQLEFQLWMEWGGRALLLCVAILGWLSSIKSWRMWKAVVVVTTAILAFGQIFSHWVVYSELIGSWAAGFSGVKYMPWSMVLPMLYLLFVLPAILLALTIFAVRRGPLQKVVAK
jgi:hypothetical protein